MDTFGLSGAWTGADIHASGRHTCRKFLCEKRSHWMPPKPPPQHFLSLQVPTGPGVCLLAQCWATVWDTRRLTLWSVARSAPDTALPTINPRTCKEGHEQGHPAQDVRPGKAPVPKAATEETDGDSSVNGQSQQDEKGWGEEGVGGSGDGG